MLLSVFLITIGIEEIKKGKAGMGYTIASIATLVFLLNVISL
ncbi:DUF3953 domain-containing protein [Bacillus thermotolerans]